MSEQLKVTSPEEYAVIVERALEKIIKLPSGMVVRARREDFEGKTLKGGLPLSLVNAAQKQKAQMEDEDEERVPTSEENEENGKFLIIMRETVRKNVLEPAIIYDDAGEVVWEWPNKVRKEILTGDFKHLFAWITGSEVDGLDSFRNRQTRRASAAQSRRKTLRGKAESDAQGQPALA